MKRIIVGLSFIALLSCGGKTEIEKKYNLTYYNEIVALELGSPKTLSGTDNTYWRVCFEKVNHNMIIRKSDNMIISVEEGCN